jgi:F-box and WD-40 domain protein 1/11
MPISLSLSSSFLQIHRFEPSAKDTTVRLWSRSTFELAHTFAGHTGPVNAIDLSRASKRVISASGDGTLILWDIRSRRLLRTFSGHSRGLACVAFVGSALSSCGLRETCGSVEGELVVSGSNDKTIRVWHASSGECLCLLEGHENLVRALAYDALTGRLVSASYDQNVIVWHLKRTPAEPEPSATDETSTAHGHREGDVPKQREVITATKLREFKGLHSSHIFDVKFDLTRIVRFVTLYSRHMHVNPKLIILRSSSHDRKIMVLDFGCDIDSSIFIPY